MKRIRQWPALSGDQPSETWQVQKAMLVSFEASCRSLFNGRNLPGARILPLGMVSSIRTRPVVCHPYLRPLALGSGPTVVRRAMRAILDQCLAMRSRNPLAAARGYVPVFRTLPCITVGSMDPKTMLWHVVLWCDVGWARPKHPDLKHTRPAWPESKRPRKYRTRKKHAGPSWGGA